MRRWLRLAIGDVLSKLSLNEVRQCHKMSHFRAIFTRRSYTGWEALENLTEMSMGGVKTSEGCDPNPERKRKLRNKAKLLET